LAQGTQNVVFVILIMIVAALFAAYNKSFRDSLREFFSLFLK